MPEVAQEAIVNHHNNYQQQQQSVCVGCAMAIEDKYVYKVSSDMMWHEECLKCVECACELRENATCVVWQRRAYCKADYYK